MEKVVFIPGDGTGLELTEAAHRRPKTTRVELAVISEPEEVAT